MRRAQFRPDRIEEILQSEKIRAANSMAQDIVKDLLNLADNIDKSCDCTQLTTARMAQLFRDIAKEIENKKVIWKWNLEQVLKASGIHPGMQEQFERCVNDANQGRQRVAKPAAPWRQELGFANDAQPSEQDIDKAFLERAKQAHPDHGGNAEDFDRVRKARELAKEELCGSKPAGINKTENYDAEQLLRCAKCNKIIL